MSSAALTALQVAINSNTLTVSQQAALSAALALIIPSFPTPDELSNSIPIPEEALARDWMAALYTIQAEGASGGIPVVTTGTIIAANTTALSAIAVASLNTAQPAIVESVGAYYSLQPIDGMTVDGITVLATADDVARVWERGATIVGEQSAAQTTWFIDAVAGDDNNTGLVGFPIKHKAEVARRWGSWSPDLRAAITINYLSADPVGGNDPGLFAPNFLGGASLIHQPAALPAPAFTGTLDVVTAKNVGANTQLESTFNTTTGAIAAGMMLVNATRGGSVAFVALALGGGNFLLTQPLAPYAPGTLPTPTNVDTWATTDAISGYQLLKVDHSFIGGDAAGLNATFAPQHVVYHLDIFDSDTAGSGLAGLVIDGQAYASLPECQVSRRTTYRNGQLNVPVFVNTAFLVGSAISCRGTTFNPIMAGGYVASGAVMYGWQYSNVPVFLGGGNIFENPADLAANDVVYIHTGGKITLKGVWSMLGASAGPFGPGTYDVRQGLHNATTAAPQLPATTTLNGSATGYSQATAGTTTTHGGITVNAANIAAAAGAAGFGGLAWTPGAAIAVNGAQP
jgi:hypothetical protein